MGNNQIMLLQFPLTYYFFASTWDTSQQEPDANKMYCVGCQEQIYPEHKELLVDSFLALRETDTEKISGVRTRLAALVNEGSAGRPGVLGATFFLTG